MLIEPVFAAVVPELSLKSYLINSVSRCRVRGAAAVRQYANIRIGQYRCCRCGNHLSSLCRAADDPLFNAADAGADQGVVVMGRSARTLRDCAEPSAYSLAVTLSPSAGLPTSHRDMVPRVLGLLQPLPNSMRSSSPGLRCRQPYATRLRIGRWCRSRKISTPIAAGENRNHCTSGSRRFIGPHPERYRTAVWK